MNAEEYLRSKYGAYKGHFTRRELEQAFNAGRAVDAVQVRNDALDEAANIAWNGPLIQQLGKAPYMTDKCRAMALQVAGNIRALKSSPVAAMPPEGE